MRSHAWPLSRLLFLHLYGSAVSISLAKSTSCSLVHLKAGKFLELQGKKNGLYLTNFLSKQKNMIIIMMMIIMVIIMIIIIIIIIITTIIMIYNNDDEKNNCNNKNNNKETITLHPFQQSSEQTFH